MLKFPRVIFMKNSEIHSEEWITDAREYWWNEDYLKLILKRYNLENISSLADIGCGEGYMSKKLIPHLKELTTCYGRDFEQTHIDKAIEILSKHKNVTFDFCACDANKININDNTVDLSVCQTLLLHVKNPLNVINEMKRITKQNGTIMAIETNNSINSLVSNSILGTTSNTCQIDNIDDTLETLKYDLTIQKGVYNLGEGYLSIGDYLPKLFYEAGLKNIQVCILDKPSALIPPYDTTEKKAIANELLSWIENSSSDYDYNQMLKYYLAGGGKENDFKLYWQKKQKQDNLVKNAILEEKYVMPGGALMYIVTANK